MASLVLGSVGSTIGGPLGGMIGSAIGSYIDNLLFAPTTKTEGPRMRDTTTTKADPGQPIPWVWGTTRQAGILIGSTDLIEVATTTKQGGKGGGGVQSTTYSYHVTCDHLLCKGPILGIGRIWADGKAIRDFANTMAIDTYANQYKVGALPYPDRYLAHQYDPELIPWSLNPADTPTASSERFVLRPDGVTMSPIDPAAVATWVAAGHMIYWLDTATGYFLPLADCVAAGFQQQTHGTVEDLTTGFSSIFGPIPAPSGSTDPITAFFAQLSGISSSNPVLYDLAGNAYTQKDYTTYQPSSVDQIKREIDFFQNEVAGTVSSTFLGTFNSEGFMNSVVCPQLRYYYTAAPSSTTFTFSAPHSLQIAGPGLNGTYAIKDFSLLYAGVDPDSLDDATKRATLDMVIQSQISWGIGGLPSRNLKVQVFAVKDYGADQSQVTQPEYNYDPGSWTAKIYEQAINTAFGDQTFTLKGVVIPRYARWLRIVIYEYTSGGTPTLLQTFNVTSLVISYYPSNAAITGEGGIVGNATGQRGWHSYYNLFAALSDFSKQSIFKMNDQTKNGMRSCIVYRGKDDQPSDTTMETAIGQVVPGYINRAHVVFDTLELADFGNRIPNFTFEIVQKETSTAQEIIEDIMDEAQVDLSLYDTTELPTDNSMTVIGYTIASQSSFRDALNAMMDAYDIDAADILDQLVFRYRRRTAIDYTVSTDELDAKNPGDAAGVRLEIHDQDVMELPRSLTLTYSDPGRDYQLSNAVYIRDSDGPNLYVNKRNRQVRKKPSTQVSTLQYPMVSYPQLMQMTAVRRMQDAWVSSTTAKFKLPHKYVYVSPTDIVAIRGALKGYNPQVQIVTGTFGSATSKRNDLPGDQYAQAPLYSKGTWIGYNGAGNFISFEGDGFAMIRGDYDCDNAVAYQDIDLKDYGLTDVDIARGGQTVRFTINANISGVFNLDYTGTWSQGIRGFANKQDANGNDAPNFSTGNTYGVDYLETLGNCTTAGAFADVNTVTFTVKPGTRYVRCYIRNVPVLPLQSDMYYKSPVIQMALNSDEQPVYDDVTVKITTATRGADGKMEIEGVLFSTPKHEVDVSLVPITQNSATSFYQRPTANVSLKPAVTALLLLDIPALRSTDNNAGFYAAFAPQEGYWPGAAFYKSLDSGASFSFLYNENTPVTAGQVVSGALLGAIDCNVPDMASSIVVELYNSNASLESITVDQLFNGMNLALVGKEVFSFLTATHLTGNQYQLSGAFLRGQAGTDRAECTDTHYVGETFVLLEQGALSSYVDDIANRNRSFPYKAVTLNEIAANVPSISFANTCQRLMPYAPTWLTGTRDGSNNLTISWQRRDRLSIGMPDYTDIPLSEAFEEYQIDIYDATFATVLRTITVDNATSTVYSAANQTADGLTPGNHVNIKVYQISDTVGRGHAAQGTV